jgi:hypothetical protein
MIVPAGVGVMTGLTRGACGTPGSLSFDLAWALR